MEQRKTPNTTFQEYYEQEVGSLSGMATFFGPLEFLKAIQNYPSFVAHKASKATFLEQVQVSPRAYSFGSDQLKEFSKISNVFAIAHFIACIEVFKGHTLPIRKPTDNELLALANERLHQNGSNSDDEVGKLTKILKQIDTVRMIHALKLFGIVPQYDISSMNQLALGAGAAYDVTCLHTIPYVFLNDKQQYVSFGLQINPPNYAVLVDNEPKFADSYRELGEDSSSKVEGIIGNATSTLINLEQRIREDTLDRFDFVSILRTDPRMIRDVREFLQRISRVINTAAHLFITIGAGNGAEEFLARKEMMRQIFETLESCKLHPKLIRMYDGEDPYVQRQCPTFGSTEYATFEAIYCQLTAKKMRKNW
jgi:hypothetical protein